ncbi:MutS-related protein [Niabella aurantiaca]|uniref:MutS-related protein n=1 Tax=Niabella aurantiaca TaxID=379900 RepID=UPI00146C5170|nr:hypothetical protein [Niabella aurantiaca]
MIPIPTKAGNFNICVFLAHTGTAVPASAAAIPFFEHIAVFINHRDDLRNGYSHFMYEIKNLKSLLLEATAGKRSAISFYYPGSTGALLCSPW